MNQYLSRQEIGRRIAKLRHLKGLSQDELAHEIELSRSSLAQIELGNRNLNVLELQKISSVLSFSLDKFLSKQFNVKQIELKLADETGLIESNNYRVSEPNLNIDKFVNILLYLLEKCAGKPNVGEKLIYKLLYFADFNYYELYEEHLTGASYLKISYGPIPQDFELIIEKMLESKRIKRIKTDYQKSKQIRYIPLEKSNLKELKASEKEVLDSVIDQFSNWSTSAIEEYSHKDLPWLVSKEGEIINYEYSLYREAPYSVRNYGN